MSLFVGRLAPEVRTRDLQVTPSFLSFVAYSCILRFCCFFSACLLSVELQF